jgi:hypothetical protein
MGVQVTAAFPKNNLLHIAWKVRPRSLLNPKLSILLERKKEITYKEGM